jgi:hypothetical protein
MRIIRLHKKPSPAGHGGGMCKRLLKSSTGPDNYKPKKWLRKLLPFA